MKKLFWQKRAGFTLIEVLISLVIFAILLLAGTAVLIMVIQKSGTITAQNEVRQNANQILSFVDASIRNSSCVDWGVTNSDLYINTFSDNCVTLVDQYKFAHADGSVFKNGNEITSSKVSVLNCGGSNASCNNYTGSYGWVRSDGRAPAGTSCETSVLKRIFSLTSCQGQLQGFLCGAPCDQGGSGQCFELLNTSTGNPITASYSSTDSCQSGDLCTLYAQNCSGVSDSGTSTSVYPQAIPLQWVVPRDPSGLGSNNNTCLTGPVLGYFDSRAGQNGQFVNATFDATYVAGGFSGFPNLSVDLTVNSNVNYVAGAPVCSGVTVRGTFTPRRGTF